MAEEDDVIRDKILTLCAAEVTRGGDVLAIAANLMVVALHIYKSCLSEEEYIALMAMIFASSDINSIPENRVIH